MNQRAMDLKAIQDSIQSGGEFRIHLIWGRTGCCKARMWHTDGFVVGQAGGSGYDRGGTALGQAIEKLLPEDLKRIRRRAVKRDESRRPSGLVERKNALYGFHQWIKDGKPTYYLDGGCGLRCMLAVLEAMGFKVQELSTGKSSTLILANRKPRKV